MPPAVLLPGMVPLVPPLLLQATEPLPPQDTALLQLRATLALRLVTLSQATLRRPRDTLLPRQALTVGLWWEVHLQQQIHTAPLREASLPLPYQGIAARA